LIGEIVPEFKIYNCNKKLLQNNLTITKLN